MDRKPFLLKPAAKDYLWGGSRLNDDFSKNINMQPLAETWECSTHPDGPSVIASGEFEGMELAELLRRFPEFIGEHPRSNPYLEAGELPILIKFIDAKKDLSVQVHPDDEYARNKEGELFGKTEMWYVISAQEGAGLYSGFSKQITPDEYVERVENNTIMDVLQFHPVKSGDVFFLPAGRIHAIGKGIFIAEIQQTSDITYRIYDYNRKDANGKGRELHTALAKDAIDYKMYSDLKTEYTHQENEPVLLANCPYFTTNLLEINSEKTVKREIADKDSFVIYICMEGEAVMVDNNGCKTELHRGETVLVPASTSFIDLSTTQSVKLLECYIPR